MAHCTPVGMSQRPMNRASGKRRITASVTMPAGLA